MISQKAKYALRALIALARAPEGEQVQIGELAVRARAPRSFLEQILLDLKRRGLVASKRGANGGYMLLKAPQAITFGEVLRLIDGPIAPLPCLSITAYQPCEDCASEANCDIRKVFARVAESTRLVLDRTTIAQAVGADEPAVVSD